MAIEISPFAATFSPHWWPSFLPTGGHLFSPRVATKLPTGQGCWGWRPRSSPPAASSGLGQRFDSFPGGGLGEPVAVSAVGDEDVGVVHEPVDGRGGDRLGHQLVEPGRVDVGADRDGAFL